MCAYFFNFNSMNTKNKVCFLTWWKTENPYVGFILEISNKVFETLETQKEKGYWSMADLEPFWVLNSQEKWDSFKKTNLYTRFKVPDMIKWVLISRNIIP